MKRCEWSVCTGRAAGIWNILGRYFPSSPLSRCEDENSAFTLQTLPRRSRGLTRRWLMRNTNDGSMLNNKAGGGAAGRFFWSHSGSEEELQLEMQVRVSLCDLWRNISWRRCTPGQQVAVQPWWPLFSFVKKSEKMNFFFAKRVVKTMLIRKKKSKLILPLYDFYVNISYSHFCVRGIKYLAHLIDVKWSYDVCVFESIIN